MAAVASPIRLSPKHLGLFKAADIADGVLEECNKLLEKNHEAYHIFYRDPAFHNHMVHSLLTTLTLGANTQELQDRYNDLVPIQRTIPAVDESLLSRLDDDEVFHAAIGQIDQYHTFLEFFKSIIASKGYRAVVLQYIFAHTKVADRMLVQMVEGAYHPIIHLGFGIEFDQPAIVAEALAQAASHDRMNIEEVLFKAEKQAAAANDLDGKTRPLIELIHDVHGNERIRAAPLWSDLGNKMKDGVVGRAGDEAALLASQFRIPHDEESLDRRTAEMVSVCAYVAGSVHEQGRTRKIDFFVMHSVTSSIFCTVLIRQDWIPLADRARIVEYKARTDLLWYAAIRAPPLNAEAISGYENPESDNLGWDELFRDVRRECDDGHAAKFIRALKNGEQTAAPYEQTDQWRAYFPCRGDMWLKMARLCQDTTKSTAWELKWVFFAGFEEPWKRPDLADPLSRFKKPVNGF
ncbi:hypothetical protein S7711_00279 [Stachybotrys chartarum IBT 7711]|uniref:Oxidoreductase AflY n=1 Tax=Stachybotrys chartarum (strain CBS 109288 / IBT 7711) TaxID=1280523 RepID=A0A084B402_STACB|nr:hypothetical protein S7711_00279 [Stachybotrys chartarum IBT 7711]KFA54243.1 hypothetical protein S40293_07820 [Stachybotrys chartarum IBT 40293]KFA71112.1 hypothetical protein S40288_04510 [Stachybotrys chartarum IBT 40288]